jgi:hypothetical protein
MKKILGIIIAIGFVLASCKKKPDQPPVTDMLGKKVHSVTELKAIATCTSCSRKFVNEEYFIGVVIADEVSGNFYKELYVRDRYNTGAIHLDFKFSTNFFVGDSIRLNLQGYDVQVNPDTYILEIDSIDYENHCVKFASGANPQPQLVTINSNWNNYLGDLVKIEKVSFISADANQVWADAVNQLSENRIIQDCDANQLTVRSSNYAKFASEKTPTGFGSITGIATKYGLTNQMEIRKPAELTMNGVANCGTVYHKKDWNDNVLTSGGWTQQSVINGSVMWTAATFGSDEFAKISGYVSGSNTNSENWLISPAIDLSTSVNPILSFLTMANFNGTALEVWVSTNYTSGAPTTGAWTQLTGFALSSSGYAKTGSGTITLNAFKMANVRIAFRYQSTTGGAKTYEVDDVIVKEL